MANRSLWGVDDAISLFRVRKVAVVQETWTEHEKFCMIIMDRFVWFGVIKLDRPIITLDTSPSTLNGIKWRHEKNEACGKIKVLSGTRGIICP